MMTQITINASALTDETLTAKARGILGWLLVAQKTQAHVSLRSMKDAGLGGRDAIWTGLDELECKGYLTRIRSVDENGHHVFTQYVVTDTPKL